ncbi:hypothetical protein O6H91_24G002400 [Diphasiastrum complanatum]|uniref:Uncharacterized protein n=1 Tax=Diphasiastrum complanatum TaxID=34168 RepID=A0ACC2A757_DIPCM|nr:hypothetical protein O6H91_24G002400 [Diphasiastrum complanatum]
MAAAGSIEARRQQLQARRGGKDRSKLVGFCRSRWLAGGVACGLALICALRILALLVADGKGERSRFFDELALVTPWSTREMEPQGWTAAVEIASNERDVEMEEEQWEWKKNSSSDRLVETDSLLEVSKEQIFTSPSRPALIAIADKKPVDRHDQAYHSLKAFLHDMREMTSNFKVFVYPHSPDDPFRKLLDPVKSDPSGNYASESYFKKALMSSHFVTQDPSEADLFYLPFSIAGLRNDRRVGVGGIQDFVKNYVHKISHNHPYWNRTNGADHFYVVCHSVGRTAMEKALHVRVNAIQVVCSSNYHVHGYVPHKDVPIPQIWPRKGTPSEAGSIKQRKNLAFFAGGSNSPVRAYLVKTWANDTDILVHPKRISTPYSESLLASKFCLHVKGYEVNTARIGDAMYYGCVPVVIADYYDLPFNDILDWKQFSVVVTASDIPRLKAILTGISNAEYVRMHNFVMELRKHFQWHSPPQESDAFYTVMYELWLRRHVLRFPLS